MLAWDLPVHPYPDGIRTLVVAVFVQRRGWQITVCTGSEEQVGRVDPDPDGSGTQVVPVKVKRIVPLAFDAARAVTRRLIRKNRSGCCGKEERYDNQDENNFPKHNASPKFVVSP